LSKSALEAQLSKNHQSKSGTKEQLVARIIENSTLGNLPRCPRCKGSLFYAVSRSRLLREALWVTDV